MHIYWSLFFKANSTSHHEKKKNSEKHPERETSANFEYNANRGMFWSHVDLQKIGKKFEQI